MDKNDILAKENNLFKGSLKGRPNFPRALLDTGAHQIKES